MTCHYVINEATLDALHKHSRQPPPPVSLQPSMPAPPVIIHMPTPDVYDLPTSKYFWMDTRGSA